MPAQGNALGIDSCDGREALKGRNNVLTRYLMTVFQRVRRRPGKQPPLPVVAMGFGQPVLYGYRPAQVVLGRLCLLSFDRNVCSLVDLAVSHSGPRAPLGLSHANEQPVLRRVGCHAPIAASSTSRQTLRLD